MPYGSRGDVSADWVEEAAGPRLRRQARDEIGLPLSVGVGSTKLIARLASGRAKPDGLVVTAGDNERSWPTSLRIAAVRGVGTTARERLRDTGVHTVRNLDRIELPELARVVGCRWPGGWPTSPKSTDDAPVPAPKPQGAGIVAS